MKGCELIQKLIDEGTENTLTVPDRLKINLHTLVCSECREYHNRTKLFEKYLFDRPENKTNGYANEILHRSTSIQIRLASFPEQNPSPIIEIEKNGKISYQNPAFQSLFPHTKGATLDHEFYKDLKLNLDKLISGYQKEFEREITFNNAYYVWRATYLRKFEVVRVFYLDITAQKKYERIISEKNREITESIRYAKRIQEAILPFNSLFNSLFADSFVLYRPKDIVAGDFYWLTSSGSWTFIAAADCTGHGVPGAMVSMVCHNALNQSVKEFSLTDPGKILDKTREIVLETFTNKDTEIKDGMDVSLLALNKTTGQILWSGANNPLWYYSGNMIHEITASKQPIGNIDNPMPFLSHELKLNKGDQVFLFTDGYADQFGGPKGKKFKYKQLQDLMLANIQIPVTAQRDVLDSTFINWKGDLEQTDDVLIIGLKI